MKLYPNGEEITKDRIEDEPWYPDFQALMEISTRQAIPDEHFTVDELLGWYQEDYRSVFKKDYPNQEQLLRWCVQQTAVHDAWVMHCTDL